MDDYALFLKKEFEGITSFTDFDLSARSTIQAGGLAKLAFAPKTVEEIVRLANGLKNYGLPFTVLGNLSNVLPADGVSDRAYILTERLTGVVERENKLFAYAGTSSNHFLRECERLQKTGGEFLTGIPCTVGGAAFMNAGVNGKYLAEIVESVLYFHDGEILSLPVSECGYAYKQSRFMDEDGVILGVQFSLSNSDGEHIRRERSRYLERRKGLPKGRSMGCVFKNPDGKSAGQLIEGAGLKGLRLGGAVVSETHANFIINDRHASANEIKNLIMLIKNAVYTQYKIRLEEEIRYLI